MDYIRKSSEIMLEQVYKTKVVRGYEDSESYFKKYGTKEQFELSAPYKYWIECSTSNLYKEELEKLVELWVEDIILGYNSFMEKAIHMADEEDYKEILIYYRNNFDGTLDYISRQYDDEYYYPSISYKFVYDVIKK